MSDQTSLVGICIVGGDEFNFFSNGFTVNVLKSHQMFACSKCHGHSKIFLELFIVGFET